MCPDTNKQQFSFLSAILPIFFISGAAGGIYEVIWAKQLLLIFGGTAFAVSTVLTSYMAGLAIGSYFFGKYIDRSPKNPIKLFALLEVGIGICGVIILLAIPLINKLYYSFYPSLVSSYYLKNIIRFAFCFVLLVVPTILMGGTLPVLSRGLFTGEESFGRYIGLLYAINTLGAMFGACIVGFFLLPNIGITHSTVTAVLFSAVTALLAYTVSRRYSFAEQPVVQPPKQKPQTKKKKVREPAVEVKLPGALLLGVAAVAGFTSMSYEVIYTRLLKLVFSNTVYAFTTILVSFLAGIGLGSLIVSRFSDRIKHRLLTLGLIQMVLGILAFWAMPTIFSSLTILNRVYEISRGLGWGGYIFSRFTVSFSVMLGVAILSGATFPLVIKFRAKERKHTGTRVGEVYSINTVAAVLGSFAGGFVIIPLFGTYWGLVVIVLLNICIGTLCILKAKLKDSRWKSIFVTVGIALVIISVVANTRTIFVGKLRKPGEKVKVTYLNEGGNASIYLLQNIETNARRLYTDGILAIDTNYESIQTVKLLGHLPVILCDDPKSVLVIGFGIGKTASSIAKHPVERIDCVEIVPEVLDAAHYFEDINDNVLSDPRLNIIIDDGRSFLFGTKHTYDVISCDPIHPAFGSPALYTKEYYTECHRKLNEGGIVVQYLPFHQLDPHDFSILLRTFQSVFPHTTIWLASYHGVIVGTKDPLTLDLADLARKINRPDVREDLEEHNISGVFGFLSRLILNEDQVSKLASKSKDINTDNHSIIEYAESRFFGKNTWITNIENIVNHMNVNPYSKIITSPEMDKALSDTLSAVYAARVHAVRGRLYYDQDRIPHALQEFFKQLEITPGDPETLLFAGDALESYVIRRGMDFARKGNATAALDNLEKAVTLGLESADIFASMGIIHISAGDTLQGITALRKALEKDPRHAVASNALRQLEKIQKQ